MARKRIPPKKLQTNKPDNDENKTLNQVLVDKDYDCGAIIRVVGLFFICMSIVGFLVYPDAVKVINHLQETEETNGKLMDVPEPKLSKREIRPHTSNAKKEHTLIKDDDHVEIPNMDFDDEEPIDDLSTGQTKTEDLMEDELRDLSDPISESTLNAEKDPGIRGRPGRDPDSPPPIILKPGSDKVTLDASRIKIVNSSQRDKEKKSSNQPKQSTGPNKPTTKQQRSENNANSASLKTDNKKAPSVNSKPSKVDSSNSKIDTSKLKGRPGRDPNSPPPIVIKPGQESITLDPSQIRFKDSSGNVVSQQTESVKNDAQKSSGKSKSKKSEEKVKTTGTKQSQSKTKKTKQKGAKDQSEDKENTKPFKPIYQKTLTPKKVFIDGRRIPAVELLHQKESNSSVRVHMFDEFLSEQECDGLIKAHDHHVANMDKQPILCFDSIATLRSHLKEAKKRVKVTPNVFTPGTRCLNATFSTKLKTWLKGNWSYSTAFYPGESKFSNNLAARIEQAMGLGQASGGKFQITSYPVGKAYKEHTDCTVDGVDKRDRMASVMIYLNTVTEEGGGETKFPDLGIWVRPRKGRALLWNNMNPSGDCEPHSKHVASVVKRGSKYILIRWYYYKSFQSLGHRPPSPSLPVRGELTPLVMCDEYGMGSCRWYDEWTWDVMEDYHKNKLNLQ